jgi:hypothetical protein
MIKKKRTGRPFIRKTQDSLYFLFDVFIDYVFSGYGITKLCESLEPNEEYKYRICVIDSSNVRSEYSDTCAARTNSKFSEN